MPPWHFSPKRAKPNSKSCLQRRHRARQNRPLAKATSVATAEANNPSSRQKSVVRAALGRAAAKAAQHAKTWTPSVRSDETKLAATRTLGIVHLRRTAMPFASDGLTTVRPHPFEKSLLSRDKPKPRATRTLPSRKKARAPRGKPSRPKQNTPPPAPKAPASRPPPHKSHQALRCPKR